MKKNRIIISGANGALGTKIVELLGAKNENILSLVKKNPKKMKNSISCNIENFNSLSKIFQEFEPTHVIHLAGITGNFECEKNPKKAFQTNVFGTYNILKSSLAHKSKIIFSSSREVYGESKTKVNENTQLNPININGITKMMSENLIMNFHKLYNIPFSIIRFTNFYGEDFSKRGISRMIKDAMQQKRIVVFGGNQEIDLIHFDDAANALLKILKTKKSNIYNIGSGKSRTISELIKEIEKCSKIKIDFVKKSHRSFEVKNFKMDISKAKSELNFKPSLELDEVIKRMSNKWVS